MLNQNHSQTRLVRDKIRVLRFLSRSPAIPGPAASPSKMALTTPDRQHVFCKNLLHSLAKDGLLENRKDKLAISDLGRSSLARLTADKDCFAAQHRATAFAEMEGVNGRQRVELDLSESPLTALASRKDVYGKPYLAGEELEAGERFRRDFEFGQLMPNVTSNWEQTSSGKGRKAGARASNDISDSSLAARGRVKTAMEAVGKDLAGVLVDFLCFHKGTSRIETERGWPRRSAKLMLKTALGLLARHYQPVIKPG